MLKHALLGLIVAAAGLLSPTAGLAASYAVDGSNACLDTTLTVTVASGNGPAGDTLTAAVLAQGAAGRRISRLHLAIEVQRRTATTWVPFVTSRHGLTYTNTPGARLYRRWTLREDSAAIDGLLDDHVQLRVYAKFKGVCRGASLGGPLLLGLSAPMIPAPTPG